MHLSRKNASDWTLSVFKPIFTSTNHGVASKDGFSSNNTEKSLPNWEVTLQSCSLAVICLLSVLGNFLVSFTLVRKDQLVLPSNRLVFNLTGANFVFSLLVLPFVVASVAEQNWLFGIFWCNFTAFFTLLVGVASILTLAMIAIDRYYAIVRPMVYTMTITTSKSTAMLLWVWIQACVCSLPPLFGWSRFEYLDTTAACTVAWGDNISYTLFLLLFCIFIPFAIMATCYYHIFQVARAKCRKIHVGTVSEAPSNTALTLSAPPVVPVGAAHNPSSHHPLSSIPKRPSWVLLSYNTVSKGIWTICLVLGAILLTWLPYVVLAIVELHCGGTSCVQHWFQVSATWLMYSSAIGYPVVYGLYNRSIRKEIKLCLCPPGAKALKGLPRRNSRRLSYTGSLLEYSPFRFRNQSRRPSTDYSRASIDLGSFAFARMGDRKTSQDSGAIMMESDMDDLAFPSTYWPNRHSSSRFHHFAAKLQRFRDSQFSKVHPLPILNAINVAASTEVPPAIHRHIEMVVVHAESGQADVLPNNDGVIPGEVSTLRQSQDFNNIPYLGESESLESPAAELGGTEELMFTLKANCMERGESIDEGIGNDCILQDVE